jgi:hypothetical protein
MCGKGTWGRYHRLLEYIVCEDNENNGTAVLPYEATAALRAEAFILTMEPE